MIATQVDRLLTRALYLLETIEDGHHDSEAGIFEQANMARECVQQARGLLLNENTEIAHDVLA
jgi:hypothetical protein